MYSTPLVLIGRGSVSPLQGSSGKVISPFDGMDTRSEPFRCLLSVWSLLDLEGRRRRIKTPHSIIKWIIPVSTTTDMRWKTMHKLSSSSKDPEKTLRRLLCSYLFGPNPLSVEEAVYRLTVELGDVIISTWLKFKHSAHRYDLALLNSLLLFAKRRPIRIREYLSYASFEVALLEERVHGANIKAYSGYSRHHKKSSGKRFITSEDPYSLELVEAPLMTLRERLEHMVLTVEGIPLPEGEASLKSALINAETVLFLNTFKKELHEQH